MQSIWILSGINRFGTRSSGGFLRILGIDKYYEIRDHLIGLWTLNTMELVASSTACLKLPLGVTPDKSNSEVHKNL